MEDYLILSIFVAILHIFALSLSILTIYTYWKVQTLKKPPGSLILNQLVILLTLQIIELIKIPLFLHHNQFLILRLNFLILIGFTVSSNYEFCIALEVFNRINKSAMGKNYVKRSRLYHIICISIGLFYTGIIMLFNDYNSGYRVIDFHIDDWLSWFYLSIPFIQLCLSITIISISYRYILTRRETPIARFLEHIINYLMILVISKIIGLFIIGLSNQINSILYSDDWPDLLILFIFKLIGVCLDILVYAVRLSEPNIRAYIQDTVKYGYLKFKYYIQ